MDKTKEKNIKVLVVDDEELIRWSLGKFLETAGFTVDIAMNGKEALQRIEEHRYDVIVTDLNMPEVSGMEMLEKISDKGCFSPVIVISSHVSENLMNDSSCNNIFRYIIKPFKMEDVLNVVKEAVECAA
jgi:two-component system response regulator AtoC